MEKLIPEQPKPGLIPHSDTLDDLIRDLSTYIRNARCIWNAYFQLYGRREHVDLLNDTAPGFFHLSQELMLDHCVISICRLLDRKQTGSHTNRVLARLMDHVPEEAMIPLYEKKSFSHVEDVNLKTWLEGRHKKTVEIASSLMTARNKRIAHIDDASHVPDENGDVKYAETLGYSYDDITNTFEAIDTFFWDFCSYYDACSRELGQYVGSHESEQLLKELRLAQDYEHLVRHNRIHKMRKRIVRNFDIDPEERQRLSRLQDRSDPHMIYYEEE